MSDLKLEMVLVIITASQEGRDKILKVRFNERDWKCMNGQFDKSKNRFDNLPIC
jgi:hypothetical protein